MLELVSFKAGGRLSSLSPMVSLLVWWVRGELPLG